MCDPCGFGDACKYVWGMFFWGGGDVVFFSKHSETYQACGGGKKVGVATKVNMSLLHVPRLAQVKVKRPRGHSQAEGWGRSNRR